MLLLFYSFILTLQTSSSHLSDLCQMIAVRLRILNLTTSFNQVAEFDYTSFKLKTLVRFTFRYILNIHISENTRTTKNVWILQVEGVYKLKSRSCLFRSEDPESQFLNLDINRNLGPVLELKVKNASCEIV